MQPPVIEMLVHLFEDSRLIITPRRFEGHVFEHGEALAARINHDHENTRTS